MKPNLFFKNASLCLLTLIWFSCSIDTNDYVNHDTRLYNTPFINTDETSQLDFGLSREEVKDILGDPLYVASGLGETNTIFWIYEVRTVLVKGDIVEINNNFPFYKEWFFDWNQLVDRKDLKTATFVHDMEEMSMLNTNDSTTKKLIESRYVPSKNNSNILHSEDSHRLELQFVDNKLTNWGPYCGDGQCDKNGSTTENDDSNEKTPTYTRKYGSVKIIED